MAAATPTPYASASLYVGDLGNEVTEALLFEIFNAVGPVASVRVCRDAATRRSLGYAYVNFHRVEDAERALDTMNFKAIRHRPCRIMWSHRDPSLRKSGLGNVFVKHLEPSIDNKQLYDTFSMFGNILSCKVATNSKGESLGYGFVHYESEEAAQLAITRANEKQIAGSVVQVSVFKSRKERGANTTATFTNVFVKNLPAKTDEASLRALFEQFGNITSIFLGVDKISGLFRGFGFVNFEKTEMARTAIERMNNSELEEKKLVVTRAQRKEEREKELRERHDHYKAEAQKKYAGVNLYVKNLSERVDDAKLFEEFQKFGSITSTKIMMDGPKSKGFGFVCFSSPEEAQRALTEMNGKMIDGKPLYVAIAQRKEIRRQQLEVQYGSRMKGPMGGHHQMYSDMAAGPQGPLGYYGMPPPRSYVFPPQSMMRQWPGQGGAGGMMPHHPNFQLMAAPINQQQRSSRGGGGGGARGPNQRTSQQVRGGVPMKYESNVRNPREHGGRQAMMMPGGISEPLTIKALANAPDDQKKQMIGERLFPLIKAQQPDNAGKITGMLLEMDNGELLLLLESPAALKEKVDEALAVLREYHADE